MSKELVIHDGVVQSRKNSVISVSLLNVAACSSCHAKGACGVSEVDNKVIEIVDSNPKLKIGQRVKVIFEQSQGPKALFYGYLLPFILLLATLIIASNFITSELTLGLLAIASVAPYYLILLLFKKKLSSNFEMFIKISDEA